MDLWIRSQNKGLHQIIGINEPYVQKDCVALIGYSNYKHIELGVYKTEKRALEVLNEIQELLEPVHITDISKKEGIIGANILYEMPEE